MQSAEQVDCLVKDSNPPEISSHHQQLFYLFHEDLEKIILLFISETPHFDILKKNFEFNQLFFLFLLFTKKNLKNVKDTRYTKYKHNLFIMVFYFYYKLI